MAVVVASYYHAATSTWTHVASDPVSGVAAIVDPVLDFDPASGALASTAANAVLVHLQAQGLQARWILETHVHADHLSAAAWLRERTGARVVAGTGVLATQDRFRRLLALEDDPVPAFDVLVEQGDRLPLGELGVDVWSTPGHSADSVTYVIDDVAFIGDTLFSPAAGTARCDFPGGSAAQLHASVQRLFALPDETRLYLCHDYPADAVAPRSVTSVGEQRRANAHLNAETTQADFVAWRERRDATLATPRLFWPALQVNIRAGALLPADELGRRFFKLPVDTRALDVPT